ncbi:MAG: SH3 domain-containing protein [Anaerolineae bacterium]
MRRQFFISSLLILLFTARVLAQDVCPELVQNALTAAESFCDGTRRDQVCYGNSNLEAIPYPDTDAFDFVAPGDIAGITNIQTLRLDGMDINSGTWGVALMKVQASLPDTNTNENVTVVLFGDVEIENQVAPSIELSATVNSDSANIRLTPSTEAAVITSLTNGTTLTVTGKNSDGSWLRVRLNGEVGGWVFAPLVSVDGDTSQLEVVGGSYNPAPGPMQAFTFSSAPNDRPCSEAPNSGLLIQTPEGVGEISFLINEVDIRLGSSAYLTTPSGGNGNQLQISLLSGHGRIESDGVAQYLLPGQTLFVPLNEEGIADGQPSDPEPYDGEGDALPIRLFPDEIIIPTPYIPDPNAPVITRIERSGLGSSTTSEDILFTDADGDATTLNIGLVDISDNQISYRFEGAEINVPEEQQQTGGVIQRETVCTQGTGGVDALLRVTIIDAAGHESNIVEYRITCVGG